MRTLAAEKFEDVIRKDQPQEKCAESICVETPLWARVKGAETQVLNFALC